MQLKKYIINQRQDELKEQQMRSLIQNIYIVNEILKDYDNVIALGDKAQIAVKNSNFNVHN